MVLSFRRAGRSSSSTAEWCEPASGGRPASGPASGPASESPSSAGPQRAWAPSGPLQEGVTKPKGEVSLLPLQVRDDVYHSILMNHLPNLLEYGNITALTNLWYTGQITNFEYLTHLNKHAGRSFNDLMQYPVFPFILADYVSETLDLGDPAVYR